MDPLSSPLTRRGFIGALGAVGGALALGACSSSKPPGAQGATGSAAGGATYDGPNVKLAFWNGWTGADGDYAKQMVSQFNKTNPKVQVQMNVYQWTDLFQKLPAAVQSGNGPDVGVIHIDDIPTQAAQQVIVPIDGIATSLKLNKSQFAPAVWNDGIYKGKRFGIPIDVHNLGLFYSKTLFEKAGLDPEKPPTNESEYMQVLDKLKGKGIQGSWVSPFQFTGGLMFQSLLWQYGGDLYNTDVSSATWDSDAGVKALTWMVDLVKQGYSPQNVGQDADFTALKNAKNALNWQGIWQVNGVTALKSTSIGLAALPKIGPQGGVWGDSHQFVLPRNGSNDQNKQAAARYFIHWFTQREAQWAKSAKVPADKSVQQSAAFQKLTDLKPFADEVPDVHFPPAVAGINDATTKLYDAVQAAVLGKSDPASALHTSAQTANRILSANKKKFG